MRRAENTDSMDVSRECVLVFEGTVGQREVDFDQCALEFTAIRRRVYEVVVRVVRGKRDGTMSRLHSLQFLGSDVVVYRPIAQRYRSCNNMNGTRRGKKETAYRRHHRFQC